MALSTFYLSSLDNSDRESLRYTACISNCYQAKDRGAIQFLSCIRISDMHPIVGQCLHFSLLQQRVVRYDDYLFHWKRSATGQYPGPVAVVSDGLDP